MKTESDYAQDALSEVLNIIESGRFHGGVLISTDDASRLLELFKAGSIASTDTLAIDANKSGSLEAWISCIADEQSRLEKKFDKASRHWGCLARQVAEIAEGKS